MLAESADRLSVVAIWIRIRHANDDWPEAFVVAAAGREHRGHQRITLIVTQGQEYWHLALDVRFEPDFPLEVNLGSRLKALYRLFLFFAKELLDGMAHSFGFDRGLGLGLDPKPGLPAWGVANVFHASSQFS